MSPRPTLNITILPEPTDSGCRVFPNKPGSDGYVRVGRHNHVRYAHVWVWESINGPVPLGYELDHTCRNRACVEPSHLELTTHVENVRRGWRRGNSRAKLTTAQVVEIRQRYASGERQRQIAARFAVDPSHVSRIVNGHYWIATLPASQQ